MSYGMKKASIWARPSRPSPMTRCKICGIVLAGKGIDEPGGDGIMLSWPRPRHWLGAAVLVAAVIYGGAVGLPASLSLVPDAAAQDVRPPEGAELSVVITPQPSDSDSWRELRHGRNLLVTVQGPNVGVAIQSEGEDWRSIRNGPLSFYGGWLLFVIILLLAVFFVLRGRIPVDAGFSGKTVERFNGIERFAHWLTATTFVVLALTGLNILYGRYFLIPLLGADLFSTLTVAGKYAHNFLAFGFMLGVVLIFVLWVRQNLPNKYDFIWIIKGGGMFSKGVHPPAKKFNAGQKILFWIVVLGGVSISVSGIALMFPFQFALFSETNALVNIFGFDLPTDLTPLQEMQLVQLWHAIVGLLFIAVIIGHIYIGTIGMEGAFDAMGSGKVDENWAHEHHNLWVAEMKGEPAPGADGEAQPAD